ncbi:MAG TPA: F-box-like domain-containing protein [Alphaproteobacteria bacterium]|nr:F-box-like domain-containing protein [Alphaproteobacteria bacterium]
MFRKSVLLSMASALAISASGAVFAMEENHERDTTAVPTVAFFSDSIAEVEERPVLPNELQVHVLSFLSTKELCGVAPVSKHFAALVSDPSLQERIKEDTISLLFTRCESSARTQHLFTSLNTNDEKREQVLADLKLSLKMHIEYGFKMDFIKETFNPEGFFFGGSNSFLVGKRSFLDILAFQSVEKNLSTASRNFRVNLGELYQKSYNLNTKQTAPLLTYENYFGTFFRFVEGMTEEEQERTVSLLSPHLNDQNFGYFYPSTLLKGLDRGGTKALNGNGKIAWLKDALWRRGYSDNPAFYEK